MSAKSAWPKTIRAKGSNVDVKVYRRETSPGNFGYQIVFRDTDGTRKMLSKSDEAEALQLADSKSTTLSTHGVKVALTSADDISVYVRMTDTLKPHGVTVEAVCEQVNAWLKTYKTLAGISAALESHSKSGASAVGIIAKPVQVAKVDFIAEHKANGESSVLHVIDLESRLDRILEPFNCDVSTITVTMLQQRLNAMNGGASNYDHNRRILSSFFGWCFRHKFHSENPAATPKKNQRLMDRIYLLKRSVPVSKKHVFTSDEMQKLLAAAVAQDANLMAEDEKAQPYFVPLMLFCGFAGLRTSEFARLRWQDVDFENGRLIVGEDEGKTSNSYRSHPMAANLKAALQPFKKLKGPVFTNIGESFDKTFQRVCTAQKICAKAAGIKWKQNAPRHSYISYRLVLKHPITEVAADAGTSAAKINSNYKSLRFDDGRFITEKDAQAWFALKLPTVKKP